MKTNFREWLPIVMIVSGLLLFGWNALSFYTGYSAPTELKVTYTDSPKVKSSNLGPLSFPKKKKLYQQIPETGEKIGELSIPKLNQSFPVYQGTEPEILKKGAGHVENSALPGEKGNSVISGHRDTIFRGLKDLKQQDRLIIATEAGTFLYKVKKIRIVDANDQTVLTPKPSATLTLTTCYPFYFMGNAPERYIVIAELIHSQFRK